jgi:hypothetical protein
MLALGRRRPPGAVLLAGRAYRHVQTVKHDFFAFTGFYDSRAGDRIVVKIGRTADFLGFPLIGLGRWSRNRELHFYRALADLPQVPRVLGTLGPTGLVHSYIPGRSLAGAASVPDGFFAALLELMDKIHRRGIAYVDANKCPNILVGDDGRPYLIDFQISWDVRLLGDTPLNRWWLRRLQREDIYHLLKHRRRLRPDELTDQERQTSQHPSLLIRAHRWLTRPYFRIRRAIFRRLRESGRVMSETTG